MADGEIRVAVLRVAVLPPREGFAPEAVGAIGMVVHRLGTRGDMVVGQGAARPFPDRRFFTPLPVLWPPLGRVARYNAGIVRRVRALSARGPAIRLIEVHNRANLAFDLARAQPDSRVVLFVHNDPQAMRRARTPADRASLLARMRVVCVSDYLRRRFMEGLDPDGPQPAVLLNAIDLAALPPPLPPDAREPTLLFVGRVVADKGADAFVAACAAILPQLPGWRAEMIGADRFSATSPDTRFLRRLRPLAAAAGVTMRGYLSHPDVMEALSRASIVAVPSRWAEPFGLAALEALASGAALVCGRGGGLPEVAGDAAVSVDPDVPGDLAGAMLTLARDPAARRTLAAAGLARAKHFDNGSAKARLLELRRGWLREGKVAGRAGESRPRAAPPLTPPAMTTSSIGELRRQQRRPLRQAAIIGGVIAFHALLLYGILDWRGGTAGHASENLIRVTIVPDKPVR